MPDYLKEPRGVTAVLHNGLRVPCTVIRDGFDPGGAPKYRLVAEIDWVTYRIRRIEIAVWPDHTALALDVPGMSPGELQAYAQDIEWVEI